jgi:TonB family protein
VISLVVDEKGEPGDLVVKRSAGALLDEAARSAVRSWRFEPARKDGVKVRVRWTVTQRFVLEP